MRSDPAGAGFPQTDLWCRALILKPLPTPLVAFLLDDRLRMNDHPPDRRHDYVGGRDKTFTAVAREELTITDGVEILIRFSYFVDVGLDQSTAFPIEVETDSVRFVGLDGKRIVPVGVVKPDVTIAEHRPIHGLAAEPRSPGLPLSSA